MLLTKEDIKKKTIRAYYHAFEKLVKHHHKLPRYLYHEKVNVWTGRFPIALADVIVIFWNVVSYGYLCRFKYMYKTMEPITYPLNLANIRSSESKEHSCHSWNRHWVQNCMRLSVGLMATGRDEIDLERLLRLIRSFNTCPRQLWHVHILDWRKPLHTKLSMSFRYLYYTSHDLSCCCSCWNGGDVEHKGAELWWLLTSINLWALFAVGQLQVLILCISWSELQQL